MVAFRENARLIVRRLGRVGDARASAVIQNSEWTHRRFRRVYENAAEHHRYVSTSGRKLVVLVLSGVRRQLQFEDTYYGSRVCRLT